MQKKYGTTQAELETLVEGFCWAMPQYTMDQIIGAIRIYVQNHSDIPAPNDLLDILDPPPPVLSAAVYVRIRKALIEGRTFVTDEEKAYVRAFEEQEMKKIRGGTDELRDAQREVDRWKRERFSGSDYD